jgi:hypothetical protein
MLYNIISVCGWRKRVELGEVMSGNQPQYGGFVVASDYRDNPRVHAAIAQLNARIKAFRSGEVVVSPTVIRVWYYPDVRLPEVDFATPDGLEALELAIEGMLATVNRYYVRPLSTRPSSSVEGKLVGMSHAIKSMVRWTIRDGRSGNVVIGVQAPDSVTLELSGDGKYLRWTCWWSVRDERGASNCVGGAVKMLPEDGDFHALALGIAGSANTQLLG